MEAISAASSSCRRRRERIQRPRPKATSKKPKTEEPMNQAVGVEGGRNGANHRLSRKERHRDHLDLVTTIQIDTDSLCDQAPVTLQLSVTDADFTLLIGEVVDDNANREALDASVR